jgi:hypothetical protein
MSAAIREGRAVSDPRDARLTAAWAEFLATNAHRVPQWLLPLARRPQGWRAWAWLGHLVWIVAAVAYAYYTLLRVLTGTWHWVLLGFLIYVVLSLPMTFRTMRRTLRAYWNAPVAARKNRELSGMSG